MKNKKMNRRNFIRAAAATGVLAVGGTALWQLDLLRGVRDTALRPSISR